MSGPTALDMASGEEADAHMDKQEIIRVAERYLEEHWDQIFEDLETLISIDSSEDKDHAAEYAPYGPGPAKALDTALTIAERLDYEVQNAEGRIGLARLHAADAAESAKTLGIISHVDVVPAGPGWTVEPFALTEREGYLLGRGTIDDKGPAVIALHAAALAADILGDLPHNLLFLLGANEENGMGDVAYFHEHFDSPDFLFTPDAEFPVCNGEMGVFHGHMRSAKVQDGAIIELDCGTALNAVPGTARAVIAADACEGLALPDASGITITRDDAENVCLFAQGKSAHASTPELGISAIKLLVDYLLQQNLCSADERAFLKFVAAMVGDTSGAGIGIATEDDFFGPLTVVGGTLELEDGHLVQGIDIRYPSSTSGEALVAALTELGQAIGATLTVKNDMEPFRVAADDPAILALLDAYNTVTGESARTFTMGGATYAREFPRAASFGLEKPWLDQPAWVGGMHGPDEGQSIAELKEAFVIYVLAICELMTIGF